MIADNPIQLPAIFEGRNVYELAAWHSLGRRFNIPDMCARIELVVDKLPECDKRIINKLKFYRK